MTNTLGTKAKTPPRLREIVLYDNMPPDVRKIIREAEFPVTLEYALSEYRMKGGNKTLAQFFAQYIIECQKMQENMDRIERRNARQKDKMLKLKMEGKLVG